MKKNTIISPNRFSVLQCIGAEDDPKPQLRGIRSNKNIIEEALCIQDNLEVLLREKSIDKNLTELFQSGKESLESEVEAYSICHDFLLQEKIVAIEARIRKLKGLSLVKLNSNLVKEARAVLAVNATEKRKEEFLGKGETGLEHGMEEPMGKAEYEFTVATEEVEDEGITPQSDNELEASSRAESEGDTKQDSTSRIITEPIEMVKTEMNFLGDKVNQDYSGPNGHILTLNPAVWDVVKETFLFEGNGENIMGANNLGHPSADKAFEKMPNPTASTMVTSETGNLDSSDPDCSSPVDFNIEKYPKKKVGDWKTSWGEWKVNCAK
ncbi:hypothetical protein U1Q18_022564 [Sarracenia purpurea var. burkii]